MLSDNEDLDYSDVQEASLSVDPLTLARPLKTQVILRIRPISTPVKNENHNSIYTVEDSVTLVVKSANPSDISRRSNYIKVNDNLTRKRFTFSRIFNLEIDQSKFFGEAIKPIVIHFLNNQNSTVVGYGTAAAGKTYTLFGTISEPGIIPRSIEFIYSSFNCVLTPSYKPGRFNGMWNVDKCDGILETEATEKFLSSRLIDKFVYEEAYEALKSSELNKNVEISKNSMYSIWISFIEIYNETVFDLLEIDEEGKNVQLKLATDKHGIAYIQGIRSICATTGLEAYEILNAGQMRISKVSATNYKSSRSHSIFIIKLLKYEKDSSTSDVKVSTISFCDLAGTGKIQKSLRNGKQFKESRSINTSLLALGRYLKVVTEDPSRQSIGPFRDSKLTRLFQHSLCGNENIILLINVNPAPELFAETHSVLKFASTAMKLTSEFTKEDKRFVNNRAPSPSSKVPEINSLRIKKYPYKQEIEDIIVKNKQLLDEVRELKSINLQREYEIRQELADFYSKQLSDLEENWKNRMLLMEEEKKRLLDFSITAVKNYYGRQLDKCSDHKRKRIDRGDYEECSDFERFENPDNLQVISISEPNKNSLKFEENDDQVLNMQVNRCNLELSLLKKILSTFVEFINNPDELKNIRNLRNIITEEIGTKKCFSKDIVSCLSTIVDFIKKPHELEKSLETFDNKGTQCNIEYTVFSKFCKEIQELLEPNFVKLPDIDDTLNLSECVQHDDVNHELITLLPILKELIIENVSKILKLEVENNEKLDQLNKLNTKIKEQERDILQSKLQNHELETVRLKLEKTIKDFEIKSKSQEFFKVLDYSTVNSIEDKEICEYHNREPQSPEHQFENNFRLSAFESESQQNSNDTERSSFDSSKNDSGVASTIDYSIGKIKDKICQTNFFEERDKNELNINYSRTKSQHLEDSSELTELSQELEDLKVAMTRLKESYFMKELIIIEYQSKISDKDAEIDRLNNENKKLETKYNELIKKVQEVSIEYEMKLRESQGQIKVDKKEDTIVSRILKDYWEKSVNVGNQLSFSYSELEKMSNACKDYKNLIDKLIKELKEKQLNENQVSQKLIKYEKDHVNVNNIKVKMNTFENMLLNAEKEKMDVQQLMYEKSKSILEIKEQTTNLDMKFEHCNKQVLSMKSELGIIVRTNLLNRWKVTELEEEVAKIAEKISKMEEVLEKSEAAQEYLEQSSNKEIIDLRSRLSTFEENAKLLNFIQDTNDNKSSQIEKLQIKLKEREKELEFFKQNRNATIQRYECLVGHLQDALKLNDQTNKMKQLLSPKHKYFSSNFKQALSCDVYNSKSRTDYWNSHSNADKYRISNSNGKSRAFFSSPEEPEQTIVKNDEDYLVTSVSEQSPQTEIRIQHTKCKGFENTCINHFVPAD